MEEQCPEPGKRKRFLAEFATIPTKVRWLVYLTVPQSFAFGYLVILISAYFPEIGFDTDEVGLLIAVTGLAFVAGAIPIGMLADKVGRKWILILGMVITTPTMFAYAYTKDMDLLVLASIVAGLSEGAFMATWNAMIADQTVIENRNAAFSLSFIVGTAAFGIGFALPFAFPPIEAAMGWSSEFVHMNMLIVVALAALLSPVTLWWLFRDFKESIRERKKYKMDASMSKLLKFSGINSLIGLGAGFIIPLIPTWLWLKFGLADDISGPLLAVASITMAASAAGSAYLAKSRGLIQAIVMTQGLSTVFMLALAFIPDAALAAVVYLVRTALMNMGSPLLDSFLMGIVTKEQRGLASAINSVVWRLPNSASTYVGGILLKNGMYEMPFFLATSFYVTAIILFYAVFRNTKPCT